MAIADGPHYEIPSAELAKWVDRFGWNHWWTIDGDRYITGWVGSPCRGDELAAVLRRAARPILVRAPAGTPGATGQVVGADEIERAAERVGDAIYEIDRTRPEPLPIWADDRCFFMAWKGETDEWVLSEDSEVSRTFANVQTTPSWIVAHHAAP